MPFLGPIAGVRVGMAGDEYVAYPDNEVLAESPLDMKSPYTAPEVVA